jgi:hypothetical protein
MVEATQRIQEAQRLRHAAIVLAQQYAIKETKRAMQARGIRPHCVAMREIRAAADDYIRAHPELIAQMAERALSIPALAKLIAGPRQRRASLRTNPQSGKTQSTGTSVVQMSCADGGAE